VYHRTLAISFRSISAGGSINWARNLTNVMPFKSESASTEENLTLTARNNPGLSRSFRWRKKSARGMIQWNIQGDM
jgi:hypothetical protein